MASAKSGSDANLFKLFLDAYINNLSTIEADPTNSTPQNNKMTRKNNRKPIINPEIIEKYFEIIRRIYHNVETPVPNFKSLFSLLYSQIKNYKTIAAKDDDIDVFHVYTHGRINFDTKFQKVPKDVVLIFVTESLRFPEIEVWLRLPPM